MLHFTFGTPATFNLTLSELATLNTSLYLFVFKRRIPGSEVSVLLSPETSDERSESFALDVDAVFAGQRPGQYTFDVYEQADTSSNTPNGSPIESGVMHLHPQTPFAFTERETSTSYTVPA